MKLGSRLLTPVAIALTLLAGPLAASGGGESFKEGVNYIPIKPHLVVNYGGPGRVKYIKAEISLRTEDAHGAQEVSHHMPLIRDTLIMLMSSRTDEQMASADGKEEMRLEALEKINEALETIDSPVEVKPKAKPKSKAAHGTDEHAADDHGKDGHGKDDHGKGDKTDHAKADKADAHGGGKSKSGNSHGKAGGHGAGGPVSDLLFDNLVVQK